MSFFLRPRHRAATLFPYTTLFRSDWLEGRGPRLYLVAMIDDATSQAYARFARHDSTEENLRVLWGYLKRWGRPVEFYTDKSRDRKSTRLNSSHVAISYAVFCLKKK